MRRIGSVEHDRIAPPEVVRVFDRCAIAGVDGAFLPQERRASLDVEQQCRLAIRPDSTDAVVAGGHDDAVLGEGFVDGSVLEFGVDEECANRFGVGRSLDERRLSIEQTDSQQRPRACPARKVECIRRGVTRGASCELDDACARDRIDRARPGREGQQLGERLQARAGQHGGACALARLYATFATKGANGLADRAARQACRVAQSGIAWQWIAGAKVAGVDRLAQCRGETYVRGLGVVKRSKAAGNSPENVAALALDMTRQVCDLELYMSRQVSS